MNDEYSYNPFEDQKLQTSQPPRMKVYDVVTTPIYDGTTVQTDVINDYEPFSNDKVVINFERTLPNEAAVASSNFENWKSDIEIKSKNILKEEDQQRVRENECRTTDRIKNFPPFPKCCPLKPCFYQDIDVDIPERCRAIVKMAYAIWIFYCVALLLNVVGTTVVLIVFTNVPGFSSNTPTLFGVSLLLLVLFIPLSYLFWFRRLYFAFKTDSSLQFFIFFIMFSMYIISLIIEIIGIPQCGVCGWILVVMTHKNTGVLIFVTIIATTFSVLLIVSCYLLLKVNMYFRSSGGSYSKAKNEIGTDPATSSTVKSVVLGLFTSSK